MHGYTPAMAPMGHQLRALEKMEGHDSFALLQEFGTGKSFTLATNAGILYRAGEVRQVLLLAPKGIYDDWTLRDPDTSHWIKSLDPSVLEETNLVQWRGGGLLRERRAMSALTEWSGLRILTMNLEALSAGGGRALETALQFTSQAPTMVVVDESTFIRSPRAARTKAVLKIGDTATHRRILTGFPTPRSSLDLYTQFRFLDWRILGYRNFWTYRAHYAVMEKLFLGSRSVDVVVGYQNTEELWRKIEPHSFRVRADECLDLPPAQYRRWDVQMTGDQGRVYREMREQCTTQLSSTEYVSATLVLTQMLRLQQIACGFVTTETGEVVDISSNRIDDLMHIIDEIGGNEKVVIWSHFTHPIPRIIKRLEDEWGHGSAVAYYGDTSDEDRRIARDRFAGDPDCRFLVGNPSVGGRGLNDLVVARHAIYFSNNPDLEVRLNSEARTRRKGSERHSSVVYIDMVCEGCRPETKLIEAFRSRADMASTILAEDWRDWI